MPAPSPFLIILGFRDVWKRTFGKLGLPVEFINFCTKWVNGLTFFQTLHVLTSGSKFYARVLDTFKRSNFTVPYLLYTSGVPKNLRRGGLEYRTNIDLRRRRKNFAIFCLILELFSPFLQLMGWAWAPQAPPRYAGAVHLRGWLSFSLLDCRWLHWTVENDQEYCKHEKY